MNRLNVRNTGDVGSGSRTRILLFGMYRLGYLSLEEMLARGLEVVGLVTKPDPLIEEEPLAQLARSRGLPLLIPTRPGGAEFLKHVRRLRPDLIAVAGYHRILPRELLTLPTRGVINLHGSLLPRHRGPVPWKWSILNGERKTGATVHLMSPELDRGPILAQESCPILPDDTSDTLLARLCTVAGPLLSETIERFLAGRLIPRPQEEEVASYEGYPTEEDTRIPWHWEADRIRNLIRGLSPRPGAWTTCRGSRIRVRQAAMVEGITDRHPGLILFPSENSLLVSTGKGTLSISDISVEGKSTVLGPLRLRALGMTPGEILGAEAPAVSLLSPG